MKNSILISIFMLCLAFVLPAQTVSVSEDLPIKNDNGYALIGKFKEQLLLFRDKLNNIYEIQAFDKNLQLGWKKEIEFEKKKVTVLNVIPDKENFSIIYFFKKDGDLILKSNKYDPGANLQDSTTITVFEKQFISPSIKIIESENKKVIVGYFFDPQKVIKAFAFNIEDMKLLWQKQFKPEGMNYYQDFNQMVADDKGNMYVVLDKDNKKNKRENHHYQIFKVNAQSNKINEFKVPLKNVLSFDVHFSYDNMNNTLVAAGLFSEKSKVKANGYFFLNLDPKQPDNHLMTFEELDEEFVASFMGKKGKNVKGITDTEITEIVHRKDGGILMFAERVKKLERRLAGSRRGYVENNRNEIIDYYFEDLFVISVHPNGKTHWKNVLHKKQYSQDDDGAYSSYFLIKSAKNLRLIFNDEISYENTVSEYVINGSGECDRNSVLSTEDQKIKLLFTQAIQIASNQIIIPSERKQKLKLIKISF